MTITSLDELLARREQWQCAAQCLVLTNGVFDLLHIGHVEYLEQARAAGDILIVGINSDESARAVKGEQRPLVPDYARARVLAALRYVDYVTIFAQPTAEALVAALRPDVYVKGGDYALASSNGRAVDESRLPEARIVRGYGGKVMLVPYRHGHSTSALIERVKQLPTTKEPLP
jgi:rfaE bifunctional protein nucleotidyltransferase chain/domain